LRPLRKVSSTAKAPPSTTPPSCWTSFTVAAAVPPVAREVVADNDAVAFLDSVFVDFEGVGAVFEGVGNAGSFCGSFWFAHGDEACAEAVG